MHELIDRVSKRMSKQDGDKLDIVFMNGDFLAHSLTKAKNLTALKNKKEYIEYLERNKKYMRQSINMVRRNLPGVPLLPSIGNDDMPFNYQVPCDRPEH